MFYTKPSQSVLAQPLSKRFPAYDWVYPKILHLRRGKWHHHGGDDCGIVVLGSMVLSKSKGREFFVPAQTLIGVKLLSAMLIFSRRPQYIKNAP